MSSVLVLRITAGPSAGRALHVDSSLVLGRGDADVVIDDQEISRRHALIRAGDGWLEIEDLDSLNGTWVMPLLPCTPIGMRLIASMFSR